MTRDSTGPWALPRGSNTSIYSSEYQVTSYGFTIPAVDGNDDDAPYGVVVHHGKNVKAKLMVAEYLIKTSK